MDLYTLNIKWNCFILQPLVQKEADCIICCSHMQNKDVLTMCVEYVNLQSETNCSSLDVVHVLLLLKGQRSEGRVFTYKICTSSSFTDNMEQLNVVEKVKILLKGLSI